MFIAMADHGGTHIDAPGACSPRGISINPYPLKKCIVPRICIELRHIARGDHAVGPGRRGQEDRRRTEGPPES